MGQELRQRLNGLPPLREVSLACEKGYPIPGTIATQWNHPRLILSLDGRSCFQFASGRLTVHCPLEPGRALFVQKGAWLGVVRTEPYCNLTIIFAPDWTRFIRVDILPSPSGELVEQVHAFAVGSLLFGPIGHVVEALSCLHSGPEKMEAALPLANALVRLLNVNLQRGVPGTAKPAEMLIEAAMDYMLQHCHQPLTRARVASALQVHPNHLSRIFSQSREETFQACLLRLRLRRAHDLLQETRMSVQEVAVASGFRSPAHFSRTFRINYGISPRLARENR